jgi:para-nitrobenzyl esterase
VNIIVGRQKTESGKPVLVLFHYGDFTCGGSVDPLLYGGRFTAGHPDVIFVSFNFRLGIFGFIDFSEVPGGEACPDTLNLGLLDQVAALQWIRENIAAFGGDPDRITVLGFSSGATSILLLAAGGQAKGLFRKAFIFNGSPVSAYETPEASRTLAKNLMKETHTATMAELLQLKTGALKAAAQKLWKDMCAPTCNGTWLPADVYQACQDGAASGIEFVIGFPGNQANVYRSLVGDRKYRDVLSAAAADLRKTMNGSVFSARQEDNDPEAGPVSGREAESKLVEQGLALSIYHAAVRLIEGGNRVHMIYWSEKPLIENLGSGTVDAAAVLLGNDDALQMYGSVMNADQSEILQGLLQKFVKGDDLELYPNEIKGVDAFDWKAFPRALIVSDGKLRCETIENRITD